MTYSLNPVVQALLREPESVGLRGEVTEAEFERSEAIVREIMAETERLGLCK